MHDTEAWDDHSDPDTKQERLVRIHGSTILILTLTRTLNMEDI